MRQRPHDSDSPAHRAALHGPPLGWVAAFCLIGLMGCGADATPKDASGAAAGGDVGQNDASDATSAALNLAATYAAQRAAILADPFIDIAHRGGRKLWPEHTTIAYDGSVALGVDMLEFDVHSSADGVIVVMHDATLERTTDGEGPLKAKNWAELEQLDAAYRFTKDGGKTFPHGGKGARIPRLDVMLDAYPNQWISLEIKQSQPPILEPVLAILNAKGALGRVIFSSFADPTLLAARKKAPQMLTSLALGETLAFESLSDVDLATYTPPAPFIQPEDAMVDAAFVARCKQVGLRIQPWTINDPKRMQALIDLGVHGMFTDDPASLRALLGAR